MIDLNKAINEFETYVKSFDIKEKNISYKYKHSYKVMEYSMSIAKSLNLSEEEINLSGLIGLLHDIGRFEQWTKYKTFRDNKSIDHGDLSISILFNDGDIRKFIDDKEYDEIIKKSISYHNKREIKDCNEKELLFSKIVRDADKLDILEILVSSYRKINVTAKEISESVVNDIYNKKSVDINDLKNDLDSKIFAVAFILDLNFKYSYELVKDKNYTNILMDSIIKGVKEKQTIDELIKIKNFINEHVEENIK
jgi:HD superfamily phosphohydrolase YqeK